MYLSCWVVDGNVEICYFVYDYWIIICLLLVVWVICGFKCRVLVRKCIFDYGPMLVMLKSIDFVDRDWIIMYGNLLFW